MATKKKPAAKTAEKIVDDPILQEIEDQIRAKPQAPVPQPLPDPELPPGQGDVVLPAAIKLKCLQLASSVKLKAEILWLTEVDFDMLLFTDGRIRITERYKKNARETNLETVWTSLANVKFWKQ